ncbi:MAG: nucleotidyltransferase family protein [Lewinellaceae bacterium]|nr:nucleotidyltransferase family protein [Lewinellaceae bacterium]
MSKRPISVILLAAGTGSRMRGDKPLSLLHGQPLIRHALRLIEELPVQERIVVVGHQAEKLFPLLAGLPVWSIYNPDFLQGIGHSIAAGIRIASQQVEAYMVLLADMPLLRSEPIIAMMDAFLQSDESVWFMRPVFQGQPGHPVLFKARLHLTLSSLSGIHGAKEIIGSNPDKIRLFAWPDATCLQDVDTPEDLEKITRLL